MAKNFPDLTGDGRVTRADVLKGRGVFKHGGSVRKMARGGALPKGPQGPRRSPQQTRSAQKQRDILQQMRDDEMSRRTREAYEEAMRESTSGMKHGGKVKGKKVKKFQAGGMTLGGIPVGPAADPNAPVQGGFGTPFMPSVPVQQRQVGGIPSNELPTPPYMPPVPVQPRQVGGTPGLAPPTVPDMGIAPGAFGGTPGLELPTVPVQPRPPMGRARPVPVPMRRPMLVPVRRPMPVRRRGMNEGGSVKKYAAGGSISSASRRADGIARKGKTRGKMC